MTRMNGYSKGLRFNNAYAEQQWKKIALHVPHDLNLVKSATGRHHNSTLQMSDGSSVLACGTYPACVPVARRRAAGRRQQLSPT